MALSPTAGETILRCSSEKRSLQAKPFIFAATKIRIGSNKRKIFECFQG